MRRNRRPQYLFGIVVLAVLLATGLTVRGQTTPAPSPTPIATATPSLERQFFTNILRDQRAIWTAPFGLQRDDARWIVPGALGTMTLITTDRITGDEVAEIDNVQRSSRIVSYPGSIYGATAVAASFYLVGRKTNDSRARETGILSAEASIDSLIVVSALKGATQRVRPQTGSERSEFFDGGASFPSGHSAQAWSVATIIANEYHDHRIVQVAAYRSRALLVLLALRAADITFRMQWLEVLWDMELVSMYIRHIIETPPIQPTNMVNPGGQ